MNLDAKAQELTKMAYHLCGRPQDDNFGDLKNAIAAALEDAERNGKLAVCTHWSTHSSSAIKDHAKDPYTGNVCTCSKCGKGFSYNPHDM